MGVEGEKERISAEVVRSGPASPIAPVLPTVNPAVEKKEVPASTVHPAVYVMCVRTLNRESIHSSSELTMNMQCLDIPELGYHHIQ